MKKTSIKELYLFTFIAHVFVLIICVAGGIFLLANIKGCMDSFGKVFGLIFAIAIVVAFIIFIICVLKVIVQLIKDYDAVKNDKAISIVGEVLGFKKNRDPESGTQINDMSIILIIDTEEEITLKINDRITVGETYKFKYLKYSKLAEVVEKI